MKGMTKQEIIKEIRRTAEENNGVPLGKERFEKQTGITSWQWNQYWARFSDALKEAGFTPNQFQSAYPEEILIKKLIEVTRKLRKFPTIKELIVERNSDPELPSKGAFERLGTRYQLAAKVKGYCEAEGGLDDVIEVCQPILEKDQKKTDFSSKPNQIIGEVYLFKSGRYYKIGKTIDAVRRGKELRIQLPEKCVLIHSIKTDDPSGIEAYWHKRFDAKRMQGEWFDLNPSEIKSFRSWRKII